jgi:hypothetical protein
MLNQLVGCPMSLGRVELAALWKVCTKKIGGHQVSDKSSGKRWVAAPGSVADRRKIHAASMLYHIQNGSVPKLAGTSNIEPSN